MHDIFEKIIAREIPAEIIYEDESVISFLDIRPINKGHALVVPKQKFINALDGDPETLGHMMQIAQKVALALIETTEASGINLLMNNGDTAGQDVFHAHLHVIPRFKRGEAFEPAQHVTYAEGEMAQLAKEIASNLA